MGILVPAEFPLSALKNEAERRVVDAFLDGLTDGWLVLPDVSLARYRDHQLDVVLIHPEFGIVDIEVKGHRGLRIVDGVWSDARHQLSPQPFTQARDNAYALRDELCEQIPSLGRLHVHYGVALPNCSGLDGRLPPDLDRAQVLLAGELDDPLGAIEDLIAVRSMVQTIRPDDVKLIVDLLRPNAEFAWDANARTRAARRRLDQLCDDQIRALQSLDLNCRVAVTGAAGTGKTRLATTWARRAYGRDERVLFTCYNEPLAAELKRRLEHDDGLRIGPFLRLALSLDGMAPLAVPDDAGNDWWNGVAVEHLSRHWPEVTERFDTIVIDEAQDFRPEWIGLLEDLLDPDGPGRMLLVADEMQSVYDRGFELPSAEEGWVQCELANNCRNSIQISRILRRRLGGAPAPAVGPEAISVRWIESSDLDVAAANVSVELARLAGEGRRAPGQILVLTTGSSARDGLRQRLGLASFESAGEDQVVCETVHRAKGLEADSVILVALQADVPDPLLYVGVSRAISELVVVGSQSVATRLGIG